MIVGVQKDRCLQKTRTIKTTNDAGWMRVRQLHGCVLFVCEQETLPPILQYGVQDAVRRHTTWVGKQHAELGI